MPAARDFGVSPHLLLVLATGGYFELTPRSVLGILYGAAFPSILCYFLWGRGVAAIGASRSWAHLQHMPLAGSAMAVALLGERLQIHQGVDIALIPGGVVLTTRGRR